MADKHSAQHLQIARLRDGGYIVTDPSFREGYATVPIFASESIDRTLAYIKDQITPAPVEQKPAPSIMGSIKGGIVRTDKYGHPL